MLSHIDEPIRVVVYDPRWPEWYAADAAEISQALGVRLGGLEHFGSTAVPGLSAKPIIDVLLAPSEWPLANRDRDALEALGYEFLGEAGVPGREYFRRRREHATNLAVVQWDGPLWRDNLLLRDYLRHHPAVAAQYAKAKQQAWSSGARTLLVYSAAKNSEVNALLCAARNWRAKP